MAIDRAAATTALEAFLRAIGRDPDLETELHGTAARVVETYADELCEGYEVDPVSVVRPHIIRGTTELVALHDVGVTTMCPHHLMPASGVGAIAFAPNERLVGLGVMVRLLDVFAHRLTLQEQVGEGVVAVLAAELEARWVACRLVLDHSCIFARGERRHGAKAETIAFAGAPSDRAAAISALRRSS